jgi:hypothetical protein
MRAIGGRGGSFSSSISMESGDLAMVSFEARGLEAVDGREICIETCISTISEGGRLG